MNTRLRLLSLVQFVLPGVGGVRGCVGGAGGGVGKGRGNLGALLAFSLKRKPASGMWFL